LGLMTPKSPSAIAIFSVVRRDHFSPVMGSPAVPYSSKNSINTPMSAVFFDRFAPAAGTTGASRGHILIEQLLAPAGNGVWIEAEECSQDAVAAVPQFDGFQAGEETALLLVQQTVEQQDGGLEFLRRNLEGGGVGHQRNSTQHSRWERPRLASSSVPRRGRIPEGHGD
jgi:hypothetical protein